LSRFSFLPLAILAAVLAVTAGCNESGPSALTVSAQNAEAIAAQGAGAVDTIDGMSDLVENFTQVMANPAAQTVIPCDAGQLNFYLNDLGEQGVLSDGDNAVFDFAGCIMDVGGQSMTLSGSLTITAVTVQGAAPGPFTLAVRADFDHLTVAFLGVTMIVHGDLTLELSSADGETLSAIASGSYLSATVQVGNQAASGWLKDFREERTLNTTTGEYLLDLDATVYSSKLGGTVVFTTTTSFTGVAPDDPESGSITAEGAENASIVLSATGGGTVEILVDADGHDAYETTINTTWTALNNA